MTVIMIYCKLLQGQFLLPVPKWEEGVQSLAVIQEPRRGSGGGPIEDGSIPEQVLDHLGDGAEDVALPTPSLALNYHPKRWWLWCLLVFGRLNFLDEYPDL